MKKIYTLYFLLALINIGQSQIILTNKILPAVNDIIPYAVDTTVSNYKIDAAGQDLIWDFSGLTIEASGNIIYRDPNTGQGKADFPTANAMLRQGLQERYLKISANKVEELGSYTRNGGGGGLPFFGANVYPKPVIIQRVPSSYEDELIINTSNTFKFSAAFLPDSVLKQLPLKPDSLKVGVSTKETKTIDAWGKLKLPAKTWDALREKRVTETNFIIEAKVPFLGWIDVTSIAQGVFPNLAGGATVNYAFLTNDAKGDILLMETDTTGSITRIQFKPNDWQVATDDNTSNKPTQLFPNPGKQYFIIEGINNFSQSSQIKLFDVYGRLVNHTIITDQSNFVNTSDLLKGIYYYHLSFAGKNSTGIWIKE